MNIYDVLQERGFIAQCTNENELKYLLSNKKITGYIGFDPTATSLHVGSLVPILSAIHFQHEGHQPLFIIGSATGLIGDPSGKTKNRNMLTHKQIKKNSSAIKEQLNHLLNNYINKPIIIDNIEWLKSLKYIDFLRDIGQHFSVNRMLSSESVKQRLEQKQGLSFIEFNYTLLQAYDFMWLNKFYNCRLQMGGNDQWGNILAGINLTRRILGIPVYGITFPLFTSSTGKKMGKTATGTIWLDPKQTSVYDFYQYWINIPDSDVTSFLKLFTFLPTKEINKLSLLQGADIRKAKQILAYEVTKIVHSETEAKIAKKDSCIAFNSLKNDSTYGIPITFIDEKKILNGIQAYELFIKTGLCKTNSEARRLISQGGAYIGKNRLTSYDQIITLKMASSDGSLWLRAGKKKYHRVARTTN